MHVLIILDHPAPDSFSAAVAQQFIAGAEAAGHSTELADLHKEGFDPRWTMTDIRGDEGQGASTDVLKERVRIERADAVCFVFPLFWWGMPAMTKGWVERVWSWGWAYDQLDDREKSLQRPRTGLFLIPAGACSDVMEDAGYLAAMETAWLQGTLGYFGFVQREIKVLNGSTGSPTRRQKLLEMAYKAGFELPFPPPND